MIPPRAGEGLILGNQVSINGCLQGPLHQISVASRGNIGRNTPPPSHLLGVNISIGQCCGSGSAAVWSVRFWASRIRIHYKRHRSGSGSGSFYHHAKLVRKPLSPNVLWLINDFLSLKNDVNVVSKSNSTKNVEKNLFLVAILKVTEENSRIRI